MIRPLRLPDLMGVAMFLRRGTGVELTSHTWPKVEPESGHFTPGLAFWQTVGVGAAWERSWIAQSGRGIAGLVVARPRVGGLIWDVEHLVVADGEIGLAEKLLEAVCQHVASQGGRRLFLEVPETAGGAELAKRSGFEKYTTSSLYRLAAPFKLPSFDGLEGRPRLRADEQRLFQLYGAAVPQLVRSAEAMTYDEWSALHRGRKKWAPTLIGDRHQFVWELGDNLAGWLHVIYGQKSQYLEILIDPKYESLVDRFVAFGMKQVSEKAPVYSTVRPYQTPLGAAFERLGFVVAARFDVYVHQLSVRVPERQLVPANIIGG